jgi:hypothetical protein
MGKAARNERRKITATLLNNLGVAFIVAGFLAPYFAVVSSETALNATREALWSGQIFKTGLDDTIHLWFPPVIGVTAGALLHAIAHLHLLGIED